MLLCLDPYANKTPATAVDLHPLKPYLLLASQILIVLSFDPEQKRREGSSTWAGSHDRLLTNLR